jgi:Tfp pilus assembly protein PilF
MKRLLLCAAAAAAIAAYAADTPGSNPSIKAPTVAERLQSARKALDAKEFSSAMRELNSALREDPRNADIHNLLGYTYRKQPQPNLVKAIDHYQTALKINPNHRGVHEYIGEAYLQDKKLSEAEKHLAELERICGRNCEEYQDLAKSIADYKTRNGG